MPFLNGCKGANMMKKKILIVGVFAVFILVAISYASAVATNTTNIEKKESPLYGLRARRAISEKLDVVIENIKTRFLGERLFCVPIQFLKNRINYLYEDECYSCTDCGSFTCRETACIMDRCTSDFFCTSKTCDIVTSPGTCSAFTCWYSICYCD